MLLSLAFSCTVDSVIFNISSTVACVLKDLSKKTKGKYKEKQKSIYSQSKGQRLEVLLKNKSRNLQPRFPGGECFCLRHSNMLQPVQCSLVWPVVVECNNKVENMEKSIAVGDSLTLGIDIGTTSVKTALINNTSGLIVARNSIEHCANLSTSENYREQSVHKLFLALNNCIKLLPRDAAKLVKDIAVCGQMHGCVLWSSESIGTLKNLADNESFILTSPLITWEDKRCSNEFLNSLPKSNFPLASGFGCATLFWLQRHQPEVICRFDCAGTVMDLVVSYLCGTTRVCMSTQNACSWGYYDVGKKEWEMDKYVLLVLNP